MRAPEFVFRAIKPEHAREYKLKYPYSMVEGRRASEMEQSGATRSERAGQPGLWSGPGK